MVEAVGTVQRVVCKQKWLATSCFHVYFSYQSAVTRIALSFSICIVNEFTSHNLASCAPIVANVDNASIYFQSLSVVQMKR